MVMERDTPEHKAYLYKESQANRDSNRHKLPPREYVWLCHAPAGVWNSGPKVIHEDSDRFVDLLDNYRMRNYTCYRYKSTGEKVDDYNLPKEELTSAEMNRLRTMGYHDLLLELKLARPLCTPKWIRENILK